MPKNDDSRDKEIRCSFCGKTQDKVRKMIAGPGSVYICNECTMLCCAIVEEDDFYEAPKKKELPVGIEKEASETRSDKRKTRRVRYRSG